MPIAEPLHFTIKPLHHWRHILVYRICSESVEYRMNLFRVAVVYCRKLVYNYNIGSETMIDVHCLWARRTSPKPNEDSDLKLVPKANSRIQMSLPYYWES